jgi:hypothetical protein
MVTGITVLGVLAGSLSSFFRLSPGGDDDAPADADTSAPVVGTPAEQERPEQNLEATLLALTREVAALRGQVEALAGRLSGGNRPTDSP